MTETNTGKIVSVLAVGTAIYLGIKHHKEKAFWIGIGAMFLAGVSVRTYKIKNA
jgi:hypothetical protein